MQVLLIALTFHQAEGIFKQNIRIKSGAIAKTDSAHHDRFIATRI
ncbi:hypothetical protein [Thalassoporum mexicanum]|nr:hypothetical protein [Pseudanabaena sp. PCC 7367]